MVTVATHEVMPERPRAASSSARSFKMSLWGGAEWENTLYGKIFASIVTRAR